MGQGNELAPIPSNGAASWAFTHPLPAGAVVLPPPPLLQQTHGMAPGVVTWPFIACLERSSVLDSAMDTKLYLRARRRRRRKQASDQRGARVTSATRPMYMRR